MIWKCFSILASLAMGAVVMTGLFALAGCGGETTSQNVIRVTRNIGGREGFRRHFDVWKATFERNNPGWQMELIDLGNAEGSAFYKSRIATGDLPEIVMTWEMTNFLADGGNLVPLPDSFYQKFGITPPAPYEGQRYTSQAGFQIQGIVVNKAMWEEIGVIEPPATWEAFFDGLDKIKAKGHKPLVLGGREWSAGQPLFYAISADMYEHITTPPDSPSWTTRKDKGEVSFAADPVARQAIERMIYLVDHFVDKGALSDGYNEEQRDFYGGKGAAWFMGCWMAGDIAPNKVDFEIDYWPVPSMLGRPPVFLCTSALPTGWAVTTTAKGEKLEKTMAAMETFYDPAVYQEFLNGECQFSEAKNVAVTGPKYDWPPAQKLIDRMKANVERYGYTLGYHIALDDMAPPAMPEYMKSVMQGIMAGERDIDKLLNMLDDDWDNGRKGT